MRIIREEWQGNKRQWTIYYYRSGKWIEEMSTVQLAHFYAMPFIALQSIDVAIIELESYYIEMLYAMIPSIHIIIDPYSLYQKTEGFNNGLNEWQEEVATTVDERIKQEKEEVRTFLIQFYKSTSLHEAYSIYEQWQCNRLLCNDIGNVVIDWIQDYEEEVFNYFCFQNMIPGLKCYREIKDK